MKFNEKKTWQIIAAVGFVLTAACFVVSIFQFFQIRQYDESPVMKFISLGINFLAFLGFCYLIFNCMNFWIYALVLYAYGVGNFIDDGNILGILCFTITIALLQKLGFFSNHRKTKISLILVCPVLALIFQAKNNEDIVSGRSINVLFSGGYDSTLVLCDAVAESKTVNCITVEPSFSFGKVERERKARTYRQNRDLL